MKLKRLIALTLSVAICAIIGTAVAMFRQAPLSYSITPQGLISSLDAAILNDNSIYVKLEGKASAGYFKLGLEGFQNLLDVGQWVLVTEASPTDAYIVLRLGEGYEIVLYENGSIYVENTYASGNTLSSACYIIENLGFDELLDYVKKNGVACSGTESMYMH